MWDAYAVYLVHSVLLSILTEEVTVQENLLVSRQSLIIIQKMRLLGWRYNLFNSLSSLLLVVSIRTNVTLKIKSRTNYFIVNLIWFSICVRTVLNCSHCGNCTIFVYLEGLIIRNFTVIMLHVPYSIIMTPNSGMTFSTFFLCKKILRSERKKDTQLT